MAAAEQRTAIDKQPLDARRIVVTGAGSGLGAAYAEASAAAGAAVVVNDLDAASAEETVMRIRANGRRAVSLAADVAEWDGARAVVEGCVSEFGGIDGVVNNAGIVSAGPMLNDDEPMVRKLFDVNVFGTVFVGVHAARAMVDGGAGGVIVNVTSGNQCGTENLSVYGATKAAVATLTYAWALDLEEHGIRVNAISPSAHTSQIETITAQLGFDPEHRDYPTPQENAAVIVYLLSEASKKLNGQVVRCDLRHISVTGHPVVVLPRVPIDEWTPEAVAQIFDDQLNDHLQPLGIVCAEIAHRGPLF